MPNNKYYGTSIDQNEMYESWISIFNTKEKNVELLYKIVESDHSDDEDLSIGCQAIVSFTVKNNLWVSRSLVSLLINNILVNVEKIKEWLDTSIGEEVLSDSIVKTWIDNRLNSILSCIGTIRTWPKIIDANYNPTYDLEQIIEKQLALGLGIEDALGNIFMSNVNLAKNKYGIHPNISIPLSLSAKIEAISNDLVGVVNGRVELKEVIGKVNELKNIKKWLI